MPGARGAEPSTIALAWLYTRPGISAAIASARTPGQLPPLLAAADIELSSEEVAELTRASDAVGT